MTKMEAINTLVNGECDKIIKGKSEFILVSGDIVNKRSKKALDTSKLLEDGWEVGIEPKWYDDIIGDNFKEFIGKTADQFILVVGFEDGKFNTENDQYPFESVTPATADEVLENLVVGGKPKKKRRVTKKKSEPAKVEGETNIADTGEEFCEPEQERQPKYTGMEEATCDAVTMSENPDNLRNEMQEEYAEASSTDTEMPEKEDIPIVEPVVEESEPYVAEGNDVPSQPQSGTSGAKTTVSQKVEDKAPSYDGPPELTGDYKAPAEYSRLTGVFINAGITIDEWDLFCEWAARKGYNLLKYVSNGRDAYFPLVPEFKEDIKTMENK
jgi:hypothetical protein